MSVYAVSVSVNFLVSLSLLAGVKLEKRWLLLPWVSWNTLSLIVSQMAVFYAPNKVFLQYFELILNIYIFLDLIYNPGHIFHCHQHLLHTLCCFLLSNTLQPKQREPN